MPNVTKYVIRTKIKDIFQKKMAGRGNIDKTTGKSTVEEINLGWAILLEGSYESLLVGNEKPDLKIGQSMKITIEPDN